MNEIRSRERVLVKRVMRRLATPLLALPLLSACSGDGIAGDPEAVGDGAQDLLLPLPPISFFDRGWDENTDRPGSTFKTFTANPDEPGTCGNACDRDASCLAFTYDPNGSATGRCQLKSGVPGSVAATGKVSGVKGHLERGYQRAGHVLKEVVVPARAEECRAACLRESACKAFSMAPTLEGGPALCQLQDTIANPTALMFSYSGVRQRNLGFDLHPEDGGTYVSPLDNPVLSGLVRTEGLTIEANTHSSTVGPHPIILRSNATSGVFPRDNRGYTFLTPPVNNRSGFLPVRVSLPTSGASLDFELTELTGTVNDRVFDTLRVKLAPDVLVLPVRLHRFVAADGTPGEYAPSEEDIRNYVDGSQAYLDHVSAVSDPITKDFRYETEVSLRATGQATPDQVWTQCGIQFRVKSYDDIRQSDGLEDDLTTTDEVCRTDGLCKQGDSTRVTSKMRPILAAQRDAIHVALGGDMGDCEGQTFGVTCAPTCGGSVRSGAYMAVMLDGNTPSTLAHEFGHFLGLPHTNDRVSCGLETDGPNIMGSGGQTLLSAAGLSPDQCAEARCMAEKWLISWGRADEGSDVDCH